jgi:mono/diheme cytochrome c family protein/methionine-rich copper-binding protein CopC/putative copper export protein
VRPADGWRVIALATWLAVGALAGLAGPVAGHAELASSDPEPNAILDGSPDGVVLRFRQAIDPETALLRVVDEHGAVLTVPGALQASVDGLELRIGLPPLEPGQYTTEYQVTSALDGHSTAGRLAFLVDPTGTLPLSVPRADLPESQAGSAAVAARWFAVAPLLAAGGTALFWVTAVLPLGALAARQRDAVTRAALPWSAVALLGLASFLGAALYLVLLAGSMGVPGRHDTGLPLDLAAPFGATPFAWSMRLTLAASIAVFILGTARGMFGQAGDWSGERGDRRVGWAVVGVVGVGLAGFAVSAHATSGGGPLAAALEWLHLGAAGVWLGAVLGALIALARGRRLLHDAMRRYLPLALGALPVLVLTGLANAPVVSGPPRELVASAYGNLLIAKAVLLSAAAGIAVMTALMLRRGSAWGWLVGGQIVAVAVGMAAVAASAALATAEPGAHRRGVVGGPPSSALHLYGEADGVRVHAVVNAPAPGVQQYQAVVTNVDGVPLDDVERVVMRFRPPDATRLDESEVELRRQEASGAWGIRGAHTPEPGEWRVDVRVLRSGEEPEATVSFNVPVTAPLPPELVPEAADGVAVPTPLALAWAMLPRGPAMWLPPGVALLALAVLLLVARRAPPAAGSRSRNAPTVGVTARVGVTALAVVLGIAAGSRALVDAAAAPPPEVAARPNPVEASGESVERGRRLYIANCAACHGADGRGGPLAGGMLPAPPPLAEAIRETTPGGLAYLIAAGTPGTPMPGFVATLSTADRWDLVNYLRDRFGAAP